MNPYKLSQVYKQLTSQNSILKKYLKLGTKDLKQPDLPAFVETKNAVNRFVRDNPRPDQLGRKDMAGGGMLVQPSADGSRPGYSGEYGPNIRESKKSNSFEVTIERGKKVFNKSFNFKTYGSKEKALEAAKEYRDEKRKIPDTRGDKKGGFGAGAPGGSKEQTGGKAKIEKILNNFIKQGKTSFSNADIRAKMNVENFYKSDLNFRRAVDVIKKQPKYKNLTFIKKPRVENPDEAAKLVRKKRQEGLKETDTTKAKGTKKYPFHHIRQITGGVPLTTDDVVIINQRMNSVMSQYDKSLNAIASAIQKNNKLALEAMNAKDEGAALKYMARVDELNETAEKIVNSAIKKLPKKYDGLVGFNQFTLPRDEYGLPISNEPMIIKKVGGMPISKNAIDLTTLNLKNEQEFRKIVRAQAEAGKTGPIKGLDELLASISANPQCQIIIRKRKADGGRIGYQSGTVSLSKCAEDGARVINSGMKNANSTQLKNFAAFANRAKNLGRNIMKFGIIPEAMYVAADATIRLTMGDKPTEALLRASEYLLPGDQTKLAEMMEAKRLSSPETAAIIGRSIDYKNQLAKIDSLTSQRDNLENLSGGGEFDYIGDLNQDVRNLDNQIKQATDALNTKFKMTDAEQTYADAMQAEVDDIRKSKSLLTKIKSKFRDTGQDSDIETLGAPEVTQEQLNKRMADLLPRDLLLASEAEMIQAAKIAQAQGFKIPDDYYIQQQQAVKNMSLAELAAATSPEQVYGAQGYIAEPLNKGVVERPQNIIGDMEREITGQTNVANPFDIDLSMIGSGLRGFSAAGGGIAKEAGVDSGVPPESGPNPQGLSYLMKRGKNI